MAMGHITPFVPRVLRGYPASLDALDQAEHVLLGNIRHWVAAVRRAADPVPQLSQAMETQGVAAAALSIDMFLRIVGRTARHPVEVRCPHCARLATDEQTILHAARLAQGRDIRMAEEILRDAMLPPLGASFAMGPLEGLGRIFTAAGLILPSRSMPAAKDAPVADLMPWLPHASGSLH